MFLCVSLQFSIYYTLCKLKNVTCIWGTNTNNLQSCALLNWKYIRFRCGCTPVTVNWFLSLFHHLLQYLRTLYIVWSLVRRRVTFLNISKHFKTVAVRLRLIFQLTYVQYCNCHCHCHFHSHCSMAVMWKPTSGVATVTTQLRHTKYAKPYRTCCWFCVQIRSQQNKNHSDKTHSAVQ